MDAITLQQQATARLGELLDTACQRWPALPQTVLGRSGGQWQTPALSGISAAGPPVWLTRPSA
ncbi:MAG: hypothetical protein R3F53_06825 [Gammaproteobacteria bacterium]